MLPWVTLLRNSTGGGALVWLFCYKCSRVLQDCQMYRFLHIGWQETILFQTWCTNSWLGLCVACLAVAAVAVLLEGIKSLSSSVSQSHLHTSMSTPLLINNSDKSVHISTKPAERGERQHHVRGLFERQHVIHTLLHVVQVTLRYTLMLVVMTFNVSLLLSIVVGSSVGNFIFSWRQTSRAATPPKHRKTDAK
ncbi:hypothetical protein LSAT2_017516 [Lamellibrachia satsuma]|nr:hypothetical protein LSAT2_017516 [Lamellibrachia satsuma]